MTNMTAMRRSYRLLRAAKAAYGGPHDRNRSYDESQ